MQTLRRSCGGQGSLSIDSPLTIIRFISSKTSQFPGHQALLDALESLRFSSDLRTATKIHARVITWGYGTYPSFMASLISTYTRCHCLHFAHRLLDQISTWPYNLDSVNVFLKSLMRMGECDAAQKLLHCLPVRDVVTWNTVIGGFGKIGRFEAALVTFRVMLNSNIEPDRYSFSSIIASCARLGILSNALWIHGLITAKKVELNSIMRAALIDMYAKCGKIQKAREIFDSGPHSDASVWNALINGLAIHELSADAMAIFSKMEAEKVLPDAITFLGILTACGHSGLVEEGRGYFNLMRSQYLIQPELKHYGAMTDLLARAGLVDEAYRMIKEMPMDPDAVIWRALLNACRFHKKPELGEVAITNISQLDSGDLVLLSNTYCSLTRWEIAERLRDSMKRQGIRKNCGKSWIDIAGAIHHFKAGDTSHPEKEALYKVLDGLMRSTRLAGFTPSMELVLMDVSEEEREANLSFHSEKLAIAYGILKSSPGMEIVVMKNLRICYDCHSWIKLVSKLLRRVMLVRDRKRFHRFEDGSCSCREYW